MSELKKLVATFYNDCLTVNEKTNTNEVLEKLLADDFQSINAGETKSKAQLIGHVHHLEEWTTAIKQLKGKAA